MKLVSEIGPVAIIPLWLVREVSPEAIRLFAYLQEYEQKYGECKAGHRVLALHIGTSISSVKRYLTELANAGAVEIFRRRAPEGEQETNLYVLRFVQPSKRPTGGRFLTSAALHLGSPGQNQGETHYIQEGGSNLNPPQVKSEPPIKVNSHLTSDENLTLGKALTHSGPQSFPQKRRRAGPFVKPTKEELEAYAAEIAFDTFDAQMFLDYYEERDWKWNDKTPMKNWKLAVRTWFRNHKTRLEGHQGPASKELKSLLDKLGE